MELLVNRRAALAVAAAVTLVVVVLFAVALVGARSGGSASDNAPAGSSSDGNPAGATAPSGDSAQPPASTEAPSDEILDHLAEPWTGDLDGIVKRGFIRILTVHNPLFFAFEGSKQQGLAHDVSLEFAKHLDEELGKVRSPTIVFIPVARDRLLPGLVEGKGDIVAGNLTITPDRSELVDFGAPLYPNIDELVVSGPAAGSLASFDDVARVGLHLRESSSYYEHLAAFNAGRERAGKQPIPVETVDEYLEDYDLLDLVNTGVLPAIVVDSHKAALWKQVFEKITVHEKLAIHSGNSVAWAVRKDSPQLLATVNDFSAKVRKGTLLGNIMLKRYMGSTRWMNDALTGDAQRRFDATVELIKRYAARYDFDWLMIAAQAYQESGFDQNKKSDAGATGIMQLLPSTAADPAVGIPDISNAENNIHAGVKYLHWLREEYFSDPAIEPLDRILFSFAAYNAGPGNTARARRKARQLGFDPNVWFGNVEIGMYRAVSGEPATYVRNIYKYYVTYRRLEATRQGRERAREELE
jgi:membrane-bound lytic murein transglycosylase MltF